MSRAAVMMALSRALQRPVSPEEVEAFMGTLLTAIPEGRMYLSPATVSDGELRARVLELRNERKGVKAIAKQLGIHRRRVRRILGGGPLSACSGPRG